MVAANEWSFINEVNDYKGECHKAFEYVDAYQAFGSRLGREDR
jgi:hypothetical protein